MGQYGKLKRINRNISYMTFILKEIIQFIFQRTLDGKYYFSEIRNTKGEINALANKIDILKDQI